MACRPALSTIKWTACCGVQRCGPDKTALRHAAGSRIRFLPLHIEISWNVRAGTGQKEQAETDHRPWPYSRSERNRGNGEWSSARIRRQCCLRSKGTGRPTLRRRNGIPEFAREGRTQTASTVLSVLPQQFQSRPSHTRRHGWQADRLRGQRKL